MVDTFRPNIELTDITETILAVHWAHRPSAARFCVTCNWIPDDPHREPDGLNEREHQAEMVALALSDLVRQRNQFFDQAVKFKRRAIERGKQLRAVMEIVSGPIGTREEEGRAEEPGSWIRGARHVKAAVRRAIEEGAEDG